MKSWAEYGKRKYVIDQLAGFKYKLRQEGKSEEEIKKLYDEEYEKRIKQLGLRS